MVTREQLIHNTDVFLPFSLGPQACPGKNVALMEIRAALCAMLQRFDFKEVKDGEGYDDVEKWESRITEVYITLRGPLRVVLSDRRR